MPRQYRSLYDDFFTPVFRGLHHESLEEVN